MKPSDPDTILTEMVEAQRMTRITNQSITIFTVDQQLYRITVNVLWAYPEQFQNFIPCLGGMHMLMSFVGAVGTLMNNTGLEELMNSAFGGVLKTLSGKKYSQNIRALRMVIEELLRYIIPDTENYAELMAILEERYVVLQFYTLLFIICLFNYKYKTEYFVLDMAFRSSQSRTTKTWVTNLIKPVLIMMQFVRAEREGDWPLHLLAAVAAMIPYLCASGHFNYARY